MTGSAVYRLKEENKLNWNTSLSKYYPEVPGSKSITMRELLNHTSGLGHPSHLRIKMNILNSCLST